jgi:hypothetical protein
MSMPDMEADEKIEFTGECPQYSIGKLSQQRAKALSKKERLVKDEPVARLDVSCN